jgi:hypothetical protein
VPLVGGSSCAGRVFCKVDTHSACVCVCCKDIIRLSLCVVYTCHSCLCGNPLAGATSAACFVRGPSSTCLLLSRALAGAAPCWLAGTFWHTLLGRVHAWAVRQVCVMGEASTIRRSCCQPVCTGPHIDVCLTVCECIDRPHACIWFQCPPHVWGAPHCVQGSKVSQRPRFPKVQGFSCLFLCVLVVADSQLCLPEPPGGRDPPTHRTDDRHLPIPVMCGLWATTECACASQQPDTKEGVSLGNSTLLCVVWWSGCCVGGAGEKDHLLDVRHQAVHTHPCCFDGVSEQAAAA